MFQIWKKKSVKEIMMYSICNGTVIPIEQIKDTVFSNRLLGDGIGFELIGNTIYAPCDGRVKLVSKTSHAFGIKANNGAEILIHVGMDTVNLNGQGLFPLVEQGDYIKVGTPILKIDRSFMEEHKICLTTPMILTNNTSYDLTILRKSGNVTINDPIFRVTKKSKGDKNEGNQKH